MDIKIIILLTIIFCCCSISSGIGGYYYKKSLDNEYNKNIDDFNKKYNINYYKPDNRLYIQSDLDNMYTVYGTIISDVTTKQISVNDIKLTLYSALIKFPIGDYYGGRLGNIKLIFDPFINEQGIFAQNMSIQPLTNYITSEKISDVTTPIITTKYIEKNFTLKLYYDPKKRVAPPFINPDFIINLQKK